MAVQTKGELGKVVAFRLSNRDAGLVAAAAAVDGRDVSAFLRPLAVSEARRRLAAAVSGTPETEGAGRG